ncbi:MAG: hypothetical protein MUO89_02050 [Dehalococcoidia bacterium]|nr:hypothetical protein [Dehalococcoidia bacterium]
MASPIPKAYAEFEVGPLMVTRSGVTVGETATVYTNVTNTGGVNGTYTAVLKVNGQESGKKDVSIGPGRTETVSFQVNKTTTGSYKLAVGESAAILNVYQWPYKIQYDLGSATEELLSVAGDYGHIVHFSPPTTPFKIQKIEVYVQAVVSQESDWTNKLITVRIWDSGRNSQLWSVNLPWRAFWNETGGFWKEIDVPNVSADGDFYVEIVTHSNQFQGETVAWPWGSDVRPAVFVGYDRPNQYISSGVSSTETRSSISNKGQPVEVPVKYQGLNWLIRVVGDGTWPTRPPEQYPQYPLPDQHQQYSPMSIISPENGFDVTWHHVVEGTISQPEIIDDPGLNVYVLVCPIEAGGLWWVEPTVVFHSNGQWEVNAYFGREPTQYPKDVGTSFYVVAIATRMRLEYGQQWYALPDHVYSSNVVIVRRK